jgi:TolA-binding protein
MKIALAFSLSLLITMQTAAQSPTETALAGVRRSDASTTVASGTVPKLAPAEHMRRAAVYLANRAFVEARAHWQALIDNYPQDPHVPEALFGIGRSYFLAKDYQAGYVAFNDLFQRFPTTKEGREALNFSAASLLRMSRFSESAARYEEYINRFPNGERIDTAHLNMIDTLREAGRPADARSICCNTSFSMSPRSSTLKNGCFSGLTRIAMMTSSNSLQPRSIISRWPLVTGSNEPG